MRPLAALLVLAPALVSAQTDEWAIKPPPGTIFTMDQLRRLQRMQNAVVEEGVAAQARGDYATAERDFRRACTFLGQDRPFQHLYLARLYDAMGLGKQAMAEYRIGVEDDREDVGVLVHYGDLCLRYGAIGGAKQGYLWTIASGRRQVYDAPVAFSRDDTAFALKSGAHTANAIRLRTSGDENRFASEIEIAAQADPRNWVARIWRAVSYQRRHRDADATKEAMVAESLAPSRTASGFGPCAGATGSWTRKATCRPIRTPSRSKGPSPSSRPSAARGGRWRGARASSSTPRCGPAR